MTHLGTKRNGTQILFPYLANKASLAWVFQNKLSSVERLEELLKYKELQDSIEEWKK